MGRKLLATPARLAAALTIAVALAACSGASSGVTPDAQPGGPAFDARAQSNGANTATRCSHGTAYRDGCSGSQSSGAQLTRFFTGWTGTVYPTRPPWNVAGVDYGVGLPSHAVLVDPTTAKLPAGCSFSNLTIRCSGTGIVVRGYDFSLHGGLKLLISGANNTVSFNKFVLAPNCSDPSIQYFVNANSYVHVLNNDFDGDGAACTSLLFGTMLSGNSQSGSTTSIEFNYFANTPDDVIDSGGPGAGYAAFYARYNLFNNDGWMAHPDGTQFNGGNFDPIVVEFNTFYTAYYETHYITQPFHIEAQLTAALRNSVVAYNTMATVGACNGGVNYPVGCSVNFDIACKQDSGSNSNVDFAAYANYIDYSGAIAALTNAYGCPSTTWGSPIANYDLSTGHVIPPP